MNAKPKTTERLFMDELLKYEQPSIVRYLVLFEVCSRLREAFSGFNISHFRLIADDLNIDCHSVRIRPHEIYESSVEHGEVAAAVWGEPPVERWKWKGRLIEDPHEPTEEDRKALLELIVCLPFVRKAWWADR